MGTNEPVMLISGTSRSIGKELAEYYVNNGFQVIGFSRSDIGSSKAGYSHHCIDISNETAIKKMFRVIRKEYGRLDVIINNAGIASMNHTLLTPLSEIHTLMNVNLIGTILCCREGAKLMKKNHYGRIVNFSSVHVPLASIGTSVYGASKAAVEHYSRVLAREVFKDGITVNVLSLSVVKESGMAEQITDQVSSIITDSTISKSQLEFEDIIHSIDYLISKNSRMITSQKIDLGGI
jgi:3-oxoacyl-[acyl-carrier protein] reductase